MTPFPVVISAPSGGGKTTIARELLARRVDVGYSVSCTTRAPRAGEQDGVDYYFLSTDAFERERRDNGFAESAEVHGHLYGTRRREVSGVLGSGRHVIMDIDVQGAAQFVKLFPESVRVFIVPPSSDVLLTRLRARASDDAASVTRRIRGALQELDALSHYEYVVVNDDLAHAVADLSCIIDAEARRRSRRVPELAAHVEALSRGLERGLSSLPPV